MRLSQHLPLPPALEVTQAPVQLPPLLPIEALASRATGRKVSPDSRLAHPRRGSRATHVCRFLSIHIGPASRGKAPTPPLAGPPSELHQWWPVSSGLTSAGRHARGQVSRPHRPAHLPRCNQRPASSSADPPGCCQAQAPPTPHPQGHTQLFHTPCLSSPSLCTTTPSHAPPQSASFLLKA